MPTAIRPEVNLSPSKTSQLPALLNHQHWFLGGALATSEQRKPEVMDIPQARACLLLAQKAGLKAAKLSLYLVQNLLLHRRDAFLDTTIKLLEPADKRRLHQHKFRDRFLFLQTATEEVNEPTLMLRVIGLWQRSSAERKTLGGRPPSEARSTNPVQTSLTLPPDPRDV